jgi:tRNA 2-thiouridine synthesizing protein A
MTLQTALHLDLKGLACPLPIVRTAKAMKDLESGALVEVLATDPGSLKDFPAWCRTTGNDLVEHGALGGGFRFVIRKR